MTRTVNAGQLAPGAVIEWRGEAVRVTQVDKGNRPTVEVAGRYVLDGFPVRFGVLGDTKVRVLVEAVGR